MKTIQVRTLQDVLDQIDKCEGKHKQQIAFSSYHKSLTQVCFDCDVVTTNIRLLNESECEHDKCKVCGSLPIEHHKYQSCLVKEEWVCDTSRGGVHCGYCSRCKAKNKIEKLDLEDDINLPTNWRIIVKINQIIEVINKLN